MTHILVAVIVLLVVGSVFAAGAICAFDSLDRVEEKARREELRQQRVAA